MQKMGYVATLMFVTTWSRKIYRNEGNKGLEYSPLILPPWRDEEGIAKVSPWNSIQLIRQGFLQIPPPPTPPLSSSPSPPTSPIPPPSPPRFSVENTLKLPLFKGLGNEDPNQFWFIARAVWEDQGVTDAHIKKETLINALQDRALTWYIKYYNDNPNAALNREFSRPKSKCSRLWDLKISWCNQAICLRN